MAALHVSLAVRYQMNQKAIFIGVNVAASLPLLVSQQAQAAGGQDTASFLKSVVAEKATAGSLNEIRPSQAATTVRYSNELSSTRAVAARTALAPVAGTVKLRPFVPGRKLPSRAQVEARLAAQVPQFDNASAINASNGALSGAVSEASYIPQVDSYNSPGYSGYTTQQIQRSQTRGRMQQAAQAYTGFERRRTPRTTPGQIAATPGQMGIPGSMPCAPQAVADMRRQDPPMQDWSQMAGAGNSAPSAADLQNIATDPEMANLAQEFMASRSSAAGAGAGTAGPAPFPLSLLPEASLKQFIGGSAKPAAAARTRQMQGCSPSYFGSWHAGSPVAQAAAGRSGPTNLAPAGFHTYLTAQPGGKMVTASSFKSYLPMAYSRKRSAPVHHGATANPNHQAPAVKHAPQAMVATYGDYNAAPL